MLQHEVPVYGFSGVHICFPNRKCVTKHQTSMRTKQIVSAAWLHAMMGCFQQAHCGIETDCRPECYCMTITTRPKTTERHIIEDLLPAMPSLDEKPQTRLGRLRYRIEPSRKMARLNKLAKTSKPDAMCLPTNRMVVRSQHLQCIDAVGKDTQAMHDF